MKLTKKFIIASILVGTLSAPLHANTYYTKDLNFPLQSLDTTVPNSEYYVKSTPENISWGSLPNKDSLPILTVPSGSTLTFDTLSHEGLLEDQGRDPVKYFAQYGVPEDMVLTDAIEIANSDINHDFSHDGPHIVTGPIGIEGAMPGDVLKVEVLNLEPRVPYGVVSNRHYKGALPGEFPKTERLETASAEHPLEYGDISVFCPIHKDDGIWYGSITDDDDILTFPINPFLGIMGVAPNTSEKTSSVPPINVGGNLDINELGIGSTLYLPIEVEGGLFYTGDPHFVQGDGEVALTALEGSLRGTVRLTLIKHGDSAIPSTSDEFDMAFAETEDYWITIGLNEDLDEAMKDSVRESINFLSKQFGIDEAKVYAYLSAGVDYEVSQVVDKTKGIHSLIPKIDFKELVHIKVLTNNIMQDVVVSKNELYIPMKSTLQALGYTIDWDNSSKSITITNGEDTISTTINSNVYVFNGETIVTASSPFISKDGITMLPVSSLSKVLDLSVNWSTNEAAIIATIN